jgi:2-keto-myo-inositol isomerase
MNRRRRSFLAASVSSGVGVLAAGAVGITDAASAATGKFGAQAAVVPAATGGAMPNFRYCLNTGTIRGQELGIEEEIRITAQAGYHGIEPWVRSIAAYVEKGGKLSDLRKLISDSGITVDSAIAFSQWIAEDPEKRRKGLEDARRDMDMLREIGGTRIAAPPAGATEDPKLDLFVVAERYRALLEIGDQIGVVPQLEVWGFSKNLSRLGETVMACTEADHPRSCILPDVYHIFKGGSGFGGLQLLSDAAMHVFHMNDYPASPSRQEMTDAHRVYPGDGVAPLTRILQMIGTPGSSCTLSLELFNRDYWKQPALDVAKTGLQKMKDSVVAAFPV